MDAEKKDELTQTPSVSEGKTAPHYAPEPSSPNDTIIQNAIEAIGMGRYQWQLLASCGFGFIADQMLLVSISLVMPQASKEFSPQYATLLPATQYAALGVGAVAFGFLADICGRRWAWQGSIFGVSVFTAVCAGSPNWAGLNVFIALAAFFGGGNLAIDLTVLAECLPRKWGFLLSGLACLWGLGNAVTGLIAWPLVVNFCCPQGATSETCTKADNMGWRYLYIIIGCLCLTMSIVRSFALGMTESPKWLISQGKLNEAVASVNIISRLNKSSVVLSVDELHHYERENPYDMQRTLRLLRGLFSGSRQLRSMICLILLWVLVGVAYPVYVIFLPYYLEGHGAKLGTGSTYQTYRDWSVSSTVGIVGPLLSAYLVQTRLLGRRRSITVTAWICAIFAGVFTTVKNEAQNLAFSSLINFWLNAMYGVIYGYTPEVMPDAYRAIGCGLTLACARLASLTSPFITTWGDVYSSVPIFVCCGLFVAIGFVSLVLPFEPYLD
ncbi:putative sugar transporter [Aspergillus campestris IBT 28561]|uniref:Sugar transporter n=1 Tax=Aspergillus campestris (strain IBT 28561) TaxID=1392248 RepID=A0A2I1DDG9_ASPC2|nr:putative sugar transporter [Aspergillus campestris IBT 28561]PKY07927.1 putative sugar transporter [Aspergillus campestris IBT 28561]